jgi:uncharacterized protein (DUF433 family)
VVLNNREKAISIHDPRLAAAYTLSEAAHYLRMPEGTLRSWVYGRLYPASGDTKRSLPLIQLDDPHRRYLSFINLVEAHVLAAMRRRHGVRLPKVRSALDYVRKQFKINRPLIDQAFQTDGLDLFVEQYGDMLNVSREGQRAMKEVITAYLERIDRDNVGFPSKLYPFTRDTEAASLVRNAPRVIVMNPAVSFGRPVIAGTGIPVSAIYERYRAGDSIAELAEDFRLNGGAIEEAIRCEAA